MFHPGQAIKSTLYATLTGIVLFAYGARIVVRWDSNGAVSTAGPLDIFAA
ncbi:hypothetical protein [Nitrospirillum iridis]|uniref:Uncharacterized protein n=1 Tax=Nitrospirillum iridis TaxID=765888 RepID=A0A7X0B0B7_9PROT|nr:hypothetical protein [Nitrospirillum iridis]MBB6253007.1 hypothetical protein [Nitrospirillum iridis]